jgi:cysteine desulfurase
VGFGAAAELAGQEMEFDNAHIKRLSEKFYSKIKERIPDVYLNGDLHSRYPGNLNISFAYVEGESLIMGLKGLALSSGSACTSASLEPSYVLRALGVDEELAHTSLRIGLGRFTTEEEIDHGVNLITKVVEDLRKISPLWEMVQEGIDIKSIKWAQH